MKFSKLFSIICVMICCCIITPAAHAQEGASDSSSSNPLLEGLMGILQESIDDFIGNYKGRLGNVKLLERRGNKIILEVTYDNVKRSDNVYVQGKVLSFGEELEGFNNTLNSVSGRQGKVKLAIGWQPQGDDGWGTSVSQAESDQIRLFLVRGTNPDRPFGEIIYDLTKTWTDSDEPEMEAAAEDSGIELEDTQAGAETKPGPSIFIKPGTILTPRTPSGTTSSSGGTITRQTPSVQTPPASRTVPPAGMKTIKPFKMVHTYDFYKNAHLGQWKSGAGALPFPARGDKRKGFAKQISKGRLNSGTNAIQMLLTHPEQKPGGRIEVLYPLFTLANKVHFKTIVGFLKGADKTDGVTFLVYVKEGSRYHRVAKQRISSKKYARIDADLSRWVGKKVQIMLSVRAGNSAVQDLAVWVKPRLSR